MTARRSSTLGVVLGRKGSGKSRWIRDQLNRRNRHAPVAIWDHVGEYGAAGSNPVSDLDGEFWSLDGFLEAQAQSRGHLGRVVIHDRQTELGRFLQWAGRAGGLLVVIDEVHLYCSPSSPCPELTELVRLSRHRRVDVWVAAQRPASIHRDLTAQADWIRSFRSTEPRDLKWLRDCCGEQFARNVAKLGRYRSCLWDGRGA